MPTHRKPFVSIIMPALNEELYLSAAIDSVIPSSHDIEFELLVLDGGSTDRTREIVQALAAALGQSAVQISPDSSLGFGACLR